MPASPETVNQIDPVGSLRKAFAAFESESVGPPPVRPESVQSRLGYVAVSDIRGGGLAEHGLWKVLGTPGQGAFGIVLSITRVDGKDSFAKAIKLSPKRAANIEIKRRAMLEGKFTGNVTAADYLVDFEQIGITAMSADGQDWVPLLGIIGIIMPAFQSVETVFPAILEGAKQSETSFLVAGLRILSMFRDMFVLLDVLHSRGAYHGDVKLGNFLLSPEGTFRLNDFGTAFTVGNEACITYSPTGYSCEEPPRGLSQAGKAIQDQITEMQSQSVEGGDRRRRVKALMMVHMAGGFNEHSDRQGLADTLREQVANLCSIDVLELYDTARCDSIIETIQPYGSDKCGWSELRPVMALAPAHFVRHLRDTSTDPLANAGIVGQEAARIAEVCYRSNPIVARALGEPATSVTMILDAFDAGIANIDKARLLVS